jgi:hypothetical protein
MKVGPSEPPCRGETGLYWAPINSEDEADYLCAIMNSAVTTEILRPFMSYGKDERDIHKHVWQRRTFFSTRSWIKLKHSLECPTAK